MEDWHDYLTVTKASLALAGVATLAVCLVIYCLLRLLRLVPRWRLEATWKKDMRAMVPVALITLGISFTASFVAGYSLSSMCGTDAATEKLSPDSKHKVVIYEYDCGAMSGASTDVSLLGSKEKLPRAPSLYHYGDFPDSNDFKVVWRMHMR